MWVLIITMFIGEFPSLTATAPVFYTEKLCQEAGEAWKTKTNLELKDIMEYSSYTCVYTGTPQSYKRK